jgi:arginine utilization protein RocB
MTPEDVSEKLMDCCREAAGDFHARFSEAQFLTQGSIEEPQAVKVVAFKSVLDELDSMGGNRMVRYKSHEAQMAEKLRLGQISFMDATAGLVELAVTLYEPKTALVVVGMMMPYYPGVSNMTWQEPKDFYPIIAAKAKEAWGQAYESRNYFTGICDLSYASFTGDPGAVEKSMENMPLWGSYYSIPFETLAEIRMPSINVGPWGKDLHQAGERVYREDLLERTPQLIDHLIHQLLSE